MKEPTVIDRKVFAGVGVIGFRMNGYRLASQSNSREHWAKTYKNKKTQHHIAALGMQGLDPVALLGSELRVTLTRIGPRELDDDNLQGAWKFFRDQIAQCIWGGRMGQRDGLAEWRYEQAKGKYAIMVTFESARRMTA